MGVALNADWRAQTQVGGCLQPPTDGRARPVFFAPPVGSLILSLGGEGMRGASSRKRGGVAHEANGPIVFYETAI